MTTEKLDLKVARRKLLELAFVGEEGHLPSSLGILEILFGIFSTLCIRPNGDDVFVLSKGHASLAYYIALERFGLIDSSTLESFGRQGAHALGGHPDASLSKGIEASTGSLGHGFPYSVGIALAKKKQQKHGWVTCLIGDGEANEGTTYESALISAHHALNNLIVFLDYNSSSEKTLSLQDIRKTWLGFGWNVTWVEGNDLVAVQQAIVSVTNSKKEIGRPSLLICKTAKGSGIHDMEQDPGAWHHKVLSEQDMSRFIGELE